MLYTEITSVCFENHFIHVNVICWQNAKRFSVKSDGAYYNDCTVKGNFYNLICIKMCSHDEQ
jgi:hypothetical protein